MASQDLMDKMSDALQAKAIKEYQKWIATEHPAAWFCNQKHGVELVVDGGRIIPAEWEPLFRTPMTADQKPAAWISGTWVTQDTTPYDTRLVWHPLYTAR